MKYMPFTYRDSSVELGKRGRYGAAGSGSGRVLDGPQGLVHWRGGDSEGLLGV
jgi:hypothetical protein